MAKIGNVQLNIKRIEAFGVRFRWHDGKDVMDNKEGIKLYPFSKAAPENMSVNDWKKIRFKKHYAGFEVEVMDGRGRPVNGKTLLRNVRSTYG